MQRWNWLVPHPHVVDKIWEGYLRSKESLPHTWPCSPGLQCRKISPYNFWLQKPVGTESVEESSGVPSSSSWRVHTGTYSYLFPLSSSTKAVGWGHQCHMRGTVMSGINVTAGGHLFWDRKEDKGHCFFSEPSPHRTTEPAGGCHIWDSINLANTVCRTL